ncbi:tetratricopeptide repeat protein, partial [Actinomyces bouchesdurhonensis]|uniref:tetratricopeptide repeat protein n=1 Tax=Actinomyces bouchesdurhonensis TaxID=1852361 RepID=UPI0028EE40B6
MNERNLWDSVKHPTGLVDMVHVGWVQRLLRSADWMGFPGPEPDLVAHGQTRVGPHARKIFEKFAELGIEWVSEPTDSEPGAQRIRPVNEVLAFRKATCIDLCVAFCCAALDAGIYPLILTVTADGGQRRHAIVLVPMERQWVIGCDVLIDEGFSRESMLPNREDLRALVVGSADDPGGTWLAIDVQQVTESDGNWKTALFLGAEYVHDWEWDVCVDVGGLRSRTPDRVLPPGGHIERVLAPAYAELPEDFTPLQLIKARHGVVPYQQRAEMRQLRAWAMTVPSDSRTGRNGRNADISVAVVTGAGGSGKTRMAAQLCDDLSKIGWYTGFLPSTTEVTDEELSALAEVTTELLVVVDYAEEARRGLVARVVRKLRARQSPTRIVLTARGADAWWEEFCEEAEQDGSVLSNTLSLSIRGKQQVEADPWFFGRMYRRAVQRFSDALNEAIPTDIEVPDGLGDTALDVVLRAWLAVCGDNDAAERAMPTREELYDRVLSTEFTRWRQEPILAEISRKHMRQAAAALSLLAPSQDEDAVDDVLSRLPEWSQEHLLRSRFAELLVQSLLRDDGAEAVSLRPDPVAEHLILTVFGKKPDLLDRVLPQDPAQVPGLDDPDAEDSVVTRALEMGQQVRNACVTLTRASSLDREVALRLARRALRERPFLWKEALDVALTQGGPLAPALEAFIESGETLPLGEIDDAIPVGHPALAGAALAATRRLATSAERSPEQQAHWANSLAVRLSDVGKRAAALGVAREAVELYRGLAEASPQAYTPDLAMSLNNLANCLSEVGDREGALGVAREAVELYRGLAEASPQAYTPDLAMSLNNLANILSAVGERNEALVAAREAVRLRRALAEASPQAYTPDLAMSLNNLANCLSAVGERKGALVAAREAVELYRGLAEASPAAYTPDLAGSLNNLANRFSAVGERNEALEAAREAVELYRGLAEASPQAY